MFYVCNIESLTNTFKNYTYLFLNNIAFWKFKLAKSTLKTEKRNKYQITEKNFCSKKYCKEKKYFAQNYINKINQNYN